MRDYIRYNRKKKPKERGYKNRETSEGKVDVTDMALVLCFMFFSHFLFQYKWVIIRSFIHEIPHLHQTCYISLK